MGTQTEEEEDTTGETALPLRTVHLDYLRPEVHNPRKETARATQRSHCTPRPIGQVGRF